MDFVRRKRGFREPITAVAQTDITDKRASPAVRIIVSLTKVGQRGGAVVEGVEFGRDLWTQVGGARPFTRRRGSFLTDRRVSAGVLEGKRLGACLV